MQKVRELIPYLIIISLLLFNIPIDVKAEVLSTNLVWDGTGQDPNGIKYGDSITFYNNRTVRGVFNKTWDNCITFKVGYTLTSDSILPKLNADYMLYVYDGQNWTETNAKVYISQTGKEYIFEPTFPNGINSLKAFAICPYGYSYDASNYFFYVTPYSILTGSPNELAVISDFDLDVEQSVSKTYQAPWFEMYKYSRKIHFFNSSVIKIGNNYFLKGKYWAEGESAVKWYYPGGVISVYPQNLYQKSYVALDVNGSILGYFNMDGTPKNGGLSSSWWKPDGTDYVVPLGSTKPNALNFQAVHSGEGGQYVQPIPQSSTNRYIGLNISAISQINAINYPAQNQVFSETDTSVAPSITVYDEDNETLTCEYYVDPGTNSKGNITVNNSATAQTLTFDGFNAGALTDGTHVIIFKISDGKNIFYKHAAIKVDKTPPITSKTTVTSTETGISLNCTAKDSNSGLAQYPYSFTIGQSSSGWTSSEFYTKTGLTPNTKYTVTFSSKDSKGHTGTNLNGVYYTKAKTPVLTASSLTPGTVNISVTENNPTGTRYQIMSGSMYVNQSGYLVETPVWITLSGKMITVKGLSSAVSYSFKAKAKNEAGIETSLSTAVNVTVN